MKKIKFNSIDVSLEIPHPVPASKSVPKWYRSMPGVVNGSETLKKCVPFLDSMTAGYTIVLAADVYIDSYGNVQQISKTTMFEAHTDDQIEGMTIPPEYVPKALKWINFFIAKTPKGYSTMFVHPLNRLDLPFYSLSGIVETDKFPVNVNFPFLVKKGFSGVVPAGTPIIQAIPFKREDWKSEVNDTKPTKIPWYISIMHNPPFGFYKKHFWVRKRYS